MNAWRKEALRTEQSLLSYLTELLGAEVDDRERRTLARRLQEARLPRFKPLGNRSGYQGAPGPGKTQGEG